MIAAFLLSLALHPVLDLASAREALAAGRHADAEAALLPLLATEEEREARLLLAETRLATGRGLEALEVLDPLIDASEEPVPFLVGQAFVAAGDELADSGSPWQDVSYYYDMALESLQVATSQGNRQAALDGGYLALYDLGDTVRARRMIDAALEKHPEDGEIALLSGCVLVNEFGAIDAETDEKASLAHWKRAVAELQRAAALLGESRGEPYYQLQWLYQAKGMPEDAIEAAVAHHERTPGDDLSTVFQLALRYAGEGDYYASTMAINAMVERDAEQYTALIAAQDDPKATAVTLSWAASDDGGKGRFEAARKVLAPLAAFEPDDAAFWNNVGFVSRETRNYEESYAAYERAVALDDTSPRLLNDTALILHYYLKRDPDRARFLYERAIALAEEALAKDPQGDLRAELELALFDARNNLRRMRE